jgi:hypothetical protein
VSREVKYNPAHLDLFSTDEDIELLKIRTEYNHEALTLIIDDIPVIAMGLRILNEYTGEVWIVPTKYLQKHKILVIKRLKELIIQMAKKYKLTRIHTTITPEFEKWIIGLGFEKECELKAYDKDTTYLYRRVFKWE